MANEKTRTLVVNRFRLGYVAEPMPGHEQYGGMMALPYLRRSVTGDWSVVSIRFRCLADCDHKKVKHGKYNTVTGDGPRIFNTMALLTPDPRVAVCEGELDTIMAVACGIPAVGVPGANTWKKHFTELFRGYEEVIALVDGDPGGKELADKVVEKLGNARAVPCPDGTDVNEYVLAHGPKALRERIGFGNSV